MNLEDIQLTGNSHILFPSLPMVDLCRINSGSLLTIKKICETVEGDWYLEPIKSAREQIKSNVDTLIEEAQEEIKKSKELMKEKFPKEYRREFWKVIRKNPFKSLLAWLLTLRSTRR